MIPTFVKGPTRSDKRDAVYKLHLDTTKAVKEMFADSTEEELEGLIAAHLKLMTPPEGAEELTLPIEAVKQTAILATQAVTRHLYERYKR